MEKKIKIAEATRFSYLVKSVMDIEPQIIETPSFRREYDQDGNIIEEIIFAPDGSISDHYTMKYDAGNLIEQTLIIDDETTETQYFRYRDGFEIELETVYADGSSDKTEKSWDSQGRLISSVTRDEDGITEKIVVTYAADGESVTEYFDEEGEKVKVVTIGFDSKSNPISIRTEDFVAEENIHEKTEWNSDGLQSKSEIYKDGQLFSVTQFFYNQKNQLEKRVIETAEGFTTLEVIFDEADREVRQVETNEEGEINLLINREYDEFGHVSFSSVEINNHGRAYDSKYDLKYSYEYFE